MKWYERQKQTYAQKNQQKTPIQPQQNTAQAQNPQFQQPQESFEPQNTYAKDAFDDMLKEDNYQNVQPDTNYDNMEAMSQSYEQGQDYEQALDEQSEPLYDNETSYDHAPTYHEPNYNQQNYKRSTFPSQHSNNDSGQATTISKSTVINGNIETDGDLLIHGHVKGDILCNANLSIYGIVEGTISCSNAYLDNAIVVGDIGCGGNMQITESSTIDGNVEAYELLNGGRIKGNAMVSESVRFLSTSAIVGDVNANDIEVERGAVIQGNIVIRQEVYFNEN